MYNSRSAKTAEVCDHDKTAKTKMRGSREKTDDHNDDKIWLCFIRFPFQLCYIVDHVTIPLILVVIQILMVEIQLKSLKFVQIYNQQLFA